MDDLARLVLSPVVGVCSVMLIVGAMWLCLCLRSWRCQCPTMPPGPPGFPIIGNLLQLGHLPHQAFARLSKSYGPLMSLRLGAVPVLVVSSPSMAAHILHTLDKVFAGRPQHISAPQISYTGCPIVFSQPGPYWRLMRQICSTEFFTNKRLGHFRPVRSHEIRSLVLSILASHGSPVSIREKLHTANSNMISCMAFGKPLHELVSMDPNSLDIVSIVLENIHLLAAFNVGDYIPSLAWMDLQGHGKRSREVAQKARSVLQAVIDNRRREGGNETRHDFLDLLLSASVNSKHKELQIQDSNIRAVLLDMLTAGTDTSALMTEWALAELLANPEKLTRVQEELDEKVGTSRVVQETDIPNLPYLRAVVKEAFRLHPVAPLLIPHMSLEACQISGYHIPANTVVYINAWAIHRDPSLWDNPLEFCPERFLKSSLLDAIPGQHFHYLPFGSGRRSCPGWRLGLLNVQFVLANLLHGFDWTSLDGKPRLNEKFGLALALEDPLIAMPMPRLPRPLYDTFP